MGLRWIPNGALDLDAAYPDIDASYGGGDNDDNIELF
jgi:methyl-accepting chemotaxis protein